MKVKEELHWNFSIYDEQIENVIKQLQKIKDAYPQHEVYMDTDTRSDNNKIIFYGFREENEKEIEYRLNREAANKLHLKEVRAKRKELELKTLARLQKKYNKLIGEKN